MLNQSQFNFPPHVIARIAAQELETGLADLMRSHPGELARVLREHIAKVKTLDTYEALDNYFFDYRGTGLKEWIDSL